MEGDKDLYEFHKYCSNFWDLQDKLKYDKLKSKMSNMPTNDKPYYFLSVNPPDTIPLAVFLKAIQKAMSKNWLTYYEYVIEQRGETEDNIHGIHTHIIFNKGKKHSDVVREMQNPFKKILDFSSPYIRNWFKLDNIDEAEMVRKTGYILDRKADPAKWAKQDIDIIMRQKYGLQKSYKMDNRRDAITANIIKE